MNSSEIIKDLMKDNGLTFQRLAELLGSTTSTISDRVNRNRSGMRVDSLVKMLEVMDCELVVRSRRKGHKELTVTVDD